jgi:YD repeat-containing protein
VIEQVPIYSYDAASQLLSLVHQLGATTINSFSYTYDKVGNRTAKVDTNGTANYTYDTLNRLVQAFRFDYSITNQQIRRSNLWRILSCANGEIQQIFKRIKFLSQFLDWRLSVCL